jgi:hypothetical protein
MLTDAGVAHLMGLTSLTGLSLDNTRITDACVGQLAALARCRTLHVAGTGLTAAGIAALQASLPGCQIIH